MTGFASRGFARTWSSPAPGRGMRSGFSWFWVFARFAGDMGFRRSRLLHRTTTTPFGSIAPWSDFPPTRSGESKSLIAALPGRALNSYAKERRSFLVGALMTTPALGRRVGDNAKARGLPAFTGKPSARNGTGYSP